MEPAVDLALMRELAAFRRAMRSFLAASEAICKEAGITAVQYQALVAICAWEGPMAVGNLADELRLTHSAAVQMVGRLVSMGLVRRDGAPDRRVVLVALTEAGQGLIVSLADRHIRALLGNEPDLSRALRRLRRRQRPAELSEQGGDGGG